MRRGGWRRHAGRMLTDAMETSRLRRVPLMVWGVLGATAWSLLTALATAIGYAAGGWTACIVALVVLALGAMLWFLRRRPVLSFSLLLVVSFLIEAWASWETVHQEVVDGMPGLAVDAVQILEGAGLVMFLVLAGYRLGRHAALPVTLGLPVLLAGARPPRPCTGTTGTEGRRRWAVSACPGTASACWARRSSRSPSRCSSASSHGGSWSAPSRTVPPWPSSGPSAMSPCPGPSATTASGWPTSSTTLPRTTPPPWSSTPRPPARSGGATRSSSAS